MRFGGAARATLGLCVVATFVSGCGDSNPAPNAAAKPAAVQALPPERPKMKPKAAQKLQDSMPHL
jgi:hypothetical protein